MKLFNKLSLIALGAIMTVGVSVGASVGHDTVATYAAATYTKVTSVGEITTGDTVIIASATNNLPTTGLTGWNGNKDATVSGTEADWIHYQVETTSGGWYLKDPEANEYIASPGSSNQFKYGTKAVCSVDANGVLKCNNRLLCKNGTYYRMYSSVGSYVPFYVWKVGDSTAEQVKVEGVTLDQTSLTLKLGDSATLSETILPETASNKKVSWSSDDETVATVVTGVITAVGIGDATITVTTEDGPFTATCEVTVEASDETYTIVKDEANLSAGDSVIIAALNKGFAISTTQNNNNRPQTPVVKSGDNAYINELVQVFTLEEGVLPGTFAFKTEQGYIYAAHSESNHLKTSTTKNENSSFKVEISDDGSALIVAQGANLRNTIQYNETSSLFSCYGGASQAPVAIYKFVDAEASDDATAYATSFLTKTATVCAITENEAAGEAPQAMKDVWTELETEYTALSSGAKDVVKTNTELVTRYNTIVAKYTGLNDFMGTGAASLNTVPMFASNNGNTNVILLVTIASLVAMGLVAVVIRRRKYNA